MWGLRPKQQVLPIECRVYTIQDNLMAATLLVLYYYQCSLQYIFFHFHNCYIKYKSFYIAKYFLYNKALFRTEVKVGPKWGPNYSIVHQLKSEFETQICYALCSLSSHSDHYYNHKKFWMFHTIHSILKIWAKFC